MRRCSPTTAQMLFGAETGILQSTGKPASQRKEESHTPFAVLQQHKHQAKDGHDQKNTEFEILTTAREVIEMPEVLGPRHDKQKKNREQNERSSADVPSP